MVKTVIKVDGMMCPMCESHVNEAVRKATGFDNVKSDHKKGETVVIGEAAVSEEAAHAAIDPTGYTVLGVRSEPWEKKKLFGIFG
ncbi:MAG: heavy-metal-associated domain-containing protein [Oscillospiraceae bacterium]|nr:heavy-metal-associated domain-containing protein [Oscillospiraceae bacterium]